MGLMGKIMEEPLWLQAWVFWMTIINTASIAFVRHAGGRVALGAWIGNLIFMTLLFETAGYVRLLGLSHVIFWTPLVIYLFVSRANIANQGIYSYWALILGITNSVSLVIDYIDVVRWLIGDGALE